MTLSDDGVIQRLRDRFVCVWRNIAGREAYAGQSNKHGAANAAVETTNGAGHHNVQMLLCAPEGRILHVLPGYWDPAALRHELDFALDLLALDRESNLPAREKKERFSRAHLDHIATHAQQGISERSRLQPFDAAHEARKPASDFFLKTEAGHRSAQGGSGAAAPEDPPRGAAPRTVPRAQVMRPLKTVDQVIHERMAKRPFVRRKDFDVASLIDMGIRHYDAYNDGCRSALT